MYFDQNELPSLVIYESSDNQESIIIDQSQDLQFQLIRVKVQDDIKQIREQIKSTKDSYHEQNLRIQLQTKTEMLDLLYKLINYAKLNKDLNIQIDKLKHELDQKMVSKIYDNRGQDDIATRRLKTQMSEQEIEFSSKINNLLYENTLLKDQIMQLEQQNKLKEQTMSDLMQEAVQAKQIMLDQLQQLKLKSDELKIREQSLSHMEHLLIRKQAELDNFDPNGESIELFRVDSPEYLTDLSQTVKIPDIQESLRKQRMFQSKQQSSRIFSPQNN
ncbi:hypothetical protein pb186bvf_012739 [Paramecium bursaria]